MMVAPPVSVSNHMSLDKAIQHGKEYRKPYTGAAAWDSHCRNNNYCSWCRGNRLHAYRRKEYSAREESLAWHRSWDEDPRYVPSDWWESQFPVSQDTHDYGTWSGLS